MIRSTIMKTFAILGAAVAVLAVSVASASAHYVDYKAVATFGSAGSGVGQFNDPIGVAVEESTGDVYVVDSENNRVERFQSDGTYISEFDGSETPAKTFEAPAGIAVDNSGGAATVHVYVADPSQNVIDVFDASGKYLSQIEIAAPDAVATDLSGHLWVGTEQPSFDEYSEAGTPMLTRPTEVGTVLGIAVDSRGNVYIANANNEKSTRFSPPTFEQGTEERDCNCSVALAIDPKTNNLIQDGEQRIIEWPPFAEGPGLWERVEEEFGNSLGRSFGIAVDGKTGRVYASDEEADDVEGFEGILVPDVVTGGASGITHASATVEGTVDAVGTKTSYFFEWGETEAYGNTTPVEKAVEGEVAVPVNVELLGLITNRTYHYRIVASNEEGLSPGADRTFTIAPVPPSVEGLPSASSPTRSSVVLHATIDPDLKPTSYHFAFVDDGAYEPAAADPYGLGGITAQVGIGAGAGGQAIEQVVSGLEPNTTYHYRVLAISEDGTDTGVDGTFTTEAASPPLALTGDSSGIAENAATISGVVDTGGLPSTYGFEVGTGTNYGPPTGLGSVGAGLSEAPVSLGLTGLQPGTTYHYRLTVTNVDGTSYGADQTFTTGVFANTFATPPAPLPFVAVPAVTFPSEASSSSTTPKALTKPQKLAAALKACHKKAKAKRGGCEKQARKKYGTANKNGKKKPGA